MMSHGKQLLSIGLGLSLAVILAQTSRSGDRPPEPIRSEGLHLNGLHLNGLHLNGLHLNTSDVNGQAAHSLEPVFPDWIDPAQTQTTVANRAADDAVRESIVLKGSQLTFKSVD